MDRAQDREIKENLGKLWTFFADGQIVAQPLYVFGLMVQAKGVRIEFLRSK
jgi:hypothetical protein